MKLEMKNGVFFDVLDRIKKNKKSFFYAILVDIGFFLSLYILGRIFNSISQNSLTIHQLLFIAIIYYLLILFIYSFFKYTVLSFVKSVFEKNKINFDRLGKFYILNIVIFIIMFVMFFLLSLFAASVKQGAVSLTSLIILSLFVVIMYAFWNICQILFYQGKNLKESLLLGVAYLGKFKQYYGVYLVILAAIGVILVAFSIFGNLLKNTFFQDYNSLLQYGNTYTIIFVHSIGIIFYLAILFNRFYFYGIVRDKFLK